MDEELERVKKRIEKRLEQHGHTDSEGTPINDAVDHLSRIEGYPSKNLSKVNIDGFPLPIRILGYFFIGAMGLFFVAFILLSVIK